MKIIVEGVDGIGKSTLVNALAATLNLATIHNKANTDNSYTYYNELASVPNLIQDRSFISEIIYSTIFNRGCKFTIYAAELLFSWYCEAKIIILYSDNQNIYINNNKDEDLELQENQAKINEAYSTLPISDNIFRFNVAEYQGKPEKLLEDVLEAIK